MNGFILSLFLCMLNKEENGFSETLFRFKFEGVLATWFNPNRELILTLSDFTVEGEINSLNKDELLEEDRPDHRLFDSWDWNKFLFRSLFWIPNGFLDRVPNAELKLDIFWLSLALN